MLKTFTKKANVVSTPHKRLAEACVEGDLEKFKQALTEVGDVNCIIADEGISAATPLIHASWYEGKDGHEEIFDYIVNHADVDFDAVDKNGNSAIVFCVYRERTDRVYKIEQAIERRAEAQRTQSNKAGAAQRAKKLV